MIIEEERTIGTKTFIYHASDAGFYILREDGVKYAEAYDLPNSGHTYTETDEKIDPDPEPAPATTA